MHTTNILLQIVDLLRTIDNSTPSGSQPGGNSTSAIKKTAVNLQFMEQFKVNRDNICCPKRNEKGTVNKNGHTRNTKLSRPQFVCKLCRQIITMQQIETEIISVTGRNRKRLTEKIMEQNQQEDITISQQQHEQRNEPSVIEDS
ncbi:hypothetical protein HPULCUR_003104 [Helicostylum pulchrum]|uniref:Uncharacterized protein n=1 Tax=Helicostylum pulchrum TaxID=562976 RepID=A0ABP9XSL8_9FUNG